MLKQIINYISSVLIVLVSMTPTAFTKTIEVNLAFVGDVNHSAYLGVKQGLKEANLQGQFLGQKYNLDVIAVSDAFTADYSKYLAVITAIEHDHFLKLSQQLSGVPVFNLTIEDDALRKDCLDNALHIIPSKHMKADALAQWEKKSPESSAVAQAWHPDFTKFAARDLNKRFLKSWQTKMDDHAWAGWAAVKIASDPVARENITDPAKLLSYLKTDLSFDGQKGIDMNFRVTGQLRQPLILVNGGKIVAEAPVRGIAKPPTVDSLGLLDCPK